LGKSEIRISKFETNPNEGNFKIETSYWLFLALPSANLAPLLMDGGGDKNVLNI